MVRQLKYRKGWPLKLPRHLSLPRNLTTPFNAYSLAGARVRYSGTVIEGDPEAKRALEKHRSFESLLATEAALRRLAGCMAEKRLCRFEVQVIQEANRLSLKLDRWNVISTPAALALDPG